MFDIFYIDKKPNLFPHEQQADSVEHAQQLSRTRFFWIVNYLCDYDNFDFLWEPVPWEAHQRHVWPSQWQKDSGTCLVPKQGYTDTNYRSQQICRQPGTPVIELIHQNDTSNHLPNTVKQVRYFSNYRDTLIRLAKGLRGQHEYIWVCSNICDYDNFDFSWHPEPWQQQMLHVFASNEQKFGDTFYMHVPSFADRAESAELLDWYDVNFVDHVTVPRHRMPTVIHHNDSHVNAVTSHAWTAPLTLFSTGPVPGSWPTVSLWREKTKTIVPLSSGASAVIVPHAAVPYIKTQLYDYANIDRTHTNTATDSPLDIVFISNGEPNAFDHWIQLINNTEYRPNRVVQVSNINGRVAAYHAAAQASQTPWFFAVFAKLEVDDRFDWSWQPDRMQQPKHYIFHALNPVNGLVYGHQAMIAYNRELVLNNPGHGLDFTLDSAHEVVPVLSGVARYNVSPWVTWRTAFREVLKLCGSPDVESQYRLKQWLATPRTNVENWAWSVWGAEDAVEYYQEVGGDFEQLRKSYDWAWLASYAFIRRNLTPDQ
jgi:hypothetical protein